MKLSDSWVLGISLSKEQCRLCQSNRLVLWYKRVPPWIFFGVCTLFAICLISFLKCSMTSSEVSLQAQHLHRHRRVLQCCCYGHGTELWARGSLVACFSKKACGVWTWSLDLLGRIDVTKRWFAVPNWSGHLMRSRLNIKTCNASMSFKKSCKEVDR